MTCVADRQQLPSGASLPRHRHGEAYVALVLEGGYEEAGVLGRVRVEPGQAVLHGAFEGHRNRIGARGARVLNLTLPAGLDLATGLGAVRDADAAARTAERDPAAALAILLDGLVRLAPRPADWLDELAGAIAAEPALRLGGWGRNRGLSPAALSRAFAGAYGETPIRFRLETRARRAWRAIVDGRAPLADIAAEAGFADPAHMGRAVKALTGRTPGAWRAEAGRPANGFKTAA